MSLFVQKFGGTSLASVERIEKIAARIVGSINAGHDIVVVVSAMGAETDRLAALASKVDYKGLDGRRELDVLLSTGEQVTIALLAMCLLKQGVRAESVLGWQTGLVTDSDHNKARVLEIDNTFLREKLREGVVPIVAGFQGVDQARNLTTLGRGGSDTTAVAIAAVLQADECQI